MPACSSIYIAAIYGHVKCFKKHIKKGFVVDDKVVTYAIRFNHIDLLEYIIDTNIVLIEQFCVTAIVNCSSECLALLLKHHCPCTEYSWVVVATRGSLGCAKVLTLYRIPWSKEVFHLAAIAGNMSVVEYLYKSGCPYTEFSLCVIRENEPNFKVYFGDVY